MLQLTSYSYVQDSLVVRGRSIGVTQGPTMTPPKKNNNKFTFQWTGEEHNG